MMAFLIHCSFPLRNVRAYEAQYVWFYKSSMNPEQSGKVPHTN
jgi:hypothetical protein